MPWRELKKSEACRGAPLMEGIVSVRGHSLCFPHRTAVKFRLFDYECAKLYVDADNKKLALQLLKEQVPDTWRLLKRRYETRVSVLTVKRQLGFEDGHYLASQDPSGLVVIDFLHPVPPRRARGAKEK